MSLSFQDQLKIKFWIQSFQDTAGIWHETGDLFVLAPSEFLANEIWEGCADWASTSQGRSLHSDYKDVRAFRFEIKKIVDPFSGLLLKKTFSLSDIFTHGEFMRVFTDFTVLEQIEFRGKLTTGVSSFTAIDTNIWPRKDLFLSDLFHVNYLIANLHRSQDLFNEEKTDEIFLHLCEEGQTPIMGNYVCKTCGKDMRSAGY